MIFSSSSLQRRQGFNPDGSHNVYCYECKDFICRTQQAISRALCERCRRVLEGEAPIDDERMKEYVLSKGVKTDVSMVLLPTAELGMKRFSLRSLGGDLLEAVGLRKIQEQAKESTKIARSKKRTRLFGNANLGAPQPEAKQSFGSITEIDAQLSKSE